MNTTPSLFDNPQDDSISLKEAADALSVSTATIRNWIKEGNVDENGSIII